MTIVLPITLTAAGAAALINIWLAFGVSGVRIKHKVSVGDGGNDSLIAAMRAHANFVEYTPFFLILVAAIELAKGDALWLWIVVAAYLLGRIAHGLGMTGAWPVGRRIGTMITLASLVLLGVVALVTPYLPRTMEVSTSRMS